MLTSGTSPAPWVLPPEKNDTIFFKILNYSGHLGEKKIPTPVCISFFKTGTSCTQLITLWECTSVPPNTLEKLQRFLHSKLIALALPLI
jgi:hypothetical protein